MVARRVSTKLRWPSPLDMAAELGTGIVRTPALERINQSLVRVSQTPGQARLGIFMSPQEGKSSTCSYWNLLWLLVNNPELRIILVSYNAEKAREWGADIKLAVENWSGDDGMLDLGLRLRADSRAAGRWKIEGHAGGLYCAGVESGISGRPGDYIVVDDPTKNMQEAQSVAKRENVTHTYRGAIIPRMGPHTKLVWIQCIVASMRVLAGNGHWVPVEEIREGDTVVSLANDASDLVSAKVLAQKLSGYDETVTVRTDRLELKANKRHPFAVLDRTRRWPKATDVEWVQAGDLKPGDIVVTAKSMPDDFVGADVLPDGSEVSEERAWLLGYMLGDGCVTAHVRKRQQGNPTSYAVYCAKTKSHRPEKADLDDRVVAALSAWSPNRVYDAGHGAFRTDWNAGGRLLRAMGYGDGARGKRVPDVVWGWSLDCRRAFLKGYAEADGSILHADRPRPRSKPVNWRIGSVNRPLLSDVRDLALTCGVRPTTIFTDKERISQPPNSPKPVAYVAHSLGLSFNPEEAEGRTLVAKALGHPSPERIRYERVRSVTEGPVLPVYDLTVEGTSNFVAEGFVTHNTLWHESETIQGILANEGSDWEVIRIPAIADSPDDPIGRKIGEPMISARGERDWKKIRRDVGEYVFAALYQQRPAPAEGNIFKRLWWRYWSYAPQLGMASPRLDLGGRVHLLNDCWRFATVDLAASTKTSGDWTVISAWAQTPDRDLILLDRVRAHIGEAEHFTNARPLVERWQLDTLFVEESQFGTTLVKEATQAGVPISPLKADTDKLTRALPASAWCSNGRVWLPAGAWWLNEWTSELAGFPNASHDDQVDTLSYAVRVAVTQWSPNSPKRLPPQQVAPAGPALPPPDPEVDFLSVPL